MNDSLASGVTTAVISVFLSVSLSSISTMLLNHKQMEEQRYYRTVDQGSETLERVTTLLLEQHERMSKYLDEIERHQPGSPSLQELEKRQWQEFIGWKHSLIAIHSRVRRFLGPDLADQLVKLSAFNDSANECEGSPPCVNPPTDNDTYLMLAAQTLGFLKRFGEIQQEWMSGEEGSFNNFGSVLDFKKFSRDNLNRFEALIGSFISTSEERLNAAGQTSFEFRFSEN